MSKANELLRQWLSVLEPNTTASHLADLCNRTEQHLADADSSQLIIAGSSRQAAHMAKAYGYELLEIGE